MLELRDIQVKRAGRAILNGISLSVKRGDKVVLTGESGSGKSTLIKTLLFFEAIDSGDILWAGQSVDSGNIREFRKQIGYVGQKPPVFDGTGREYLSLPWTFAQNSGSEPTKDSLDHLLSSMELSELNLDNPYMALSGGEQQRLTLAQTLFLKRPILVLDEVTSSLHSANVAKIVDLVLEDPELTVVAVSHQDRWLRSNVRILEVNEGTLTERTQK